MDNKKQIKEMEELLSEYYENIDDSFASVDIAMEIVDRVDYFVKRLQELEEAIADYAYEIRKRKRALNKKTNKTNAIGKRWSFMRMKNHGVYTTIMVELS